jgi:hypothetical protein
MPTSNSAPRFSRPNDRLSPPRLDPATGRSRVVDNCTLVVLGIAAGVAGTLSARGAHAMFPGDWALPVAFALVVQIIVTLSLWTFALPRMRFASRVLLLAAWAVAVTFSIGSAFYASYENNAQEVVKDLTDRVAQSFTKIKERARETETAALLANKMADDEADHGTYSKGVPGRKQKYRELRRKAVDAGAKATEAKEIEKTVDTALDALNQHGMTVESVRNIYRATLAQVGSYGNGVPPLTFSDDRSSFVTIVVSAIDIASGRDTSVSATERRRVQGSLGSASIMEILALLSSLIRMVMHRDPKERGGPREGGHCSRFLEMLFSLAQIPEQLRNSKLAADLLAQQAAVYRVERWRQSQSDFVAATHGEKPERVWTDAIEAYLATVNPQGHRKAILALLPSYLGIQRRPAPEQMYDTNALFDARVFESNPIIVQAAHSTEAIIKLPEGGLAPGPRWHAWIRFLVGKLAKLPAQRPNRASTGRPKLKVVGGN